MKPKQHCRLPIIQRRVNYYSSIRFTAKDEDIYTNITLQVGEAIDIKSIDDSDERSYALIKVIMILYIKMILNEIILFY